MCAISGISFLLFFAFIDSMEKKNLLTFFNLIVRFPVLVVVDCVNCEKYKLSMMNLLFKKGKKYSVSLIKLNWAFSFCMKKKLHSNFESFSDPIKNNFTKLCHSSGSIEKFQFIRNDFFFCLFSHNPISFSPEMNDAR